MSNLAITKPTFIPAKFYELQDSNLPAAVEKVAIVNATLETDADKRRCLLTYIEANSDKLKTWQYNPETGYISDLLILLETVIGFRINKFAGYEIALYAQIRCALESVGETYPQIGRLEIFAAIKYALKYKPEILKPYDTKDDISTFTGLYLCTIVKYYLDEYRNNAMRKVDEMFSQVTFIKNIEENNLYKIRYYRDLSMMVLQNIGEYLTFGRFKMEFTYMSYGEILYKNMQNIGFLKGSQEYKDIWVKWNPQKTAKYTAEMKFGFMKEVITNEIEKYRAFDKAFYDTNVLYFIFCGSDYVEFEVKGKNISAIKKSLKKQKRPAHAEIVMCARSGKNIFSYQNTLIRLALDMGFLQDVKQSDFDLTKDMDIAEMIERYGKKIVSLFPLKKEEVVIRQFDSESIFSSIANASYKNNIT